MNLSSARPIAEHLHSVLSPHCIRCEVAGSVRRAKPEVHDIELICIPKPGFPPVAFGDKTIFPNYLDKTLFTLCAEGWLRRIKGGDKYRQYEIALGKFGFFASSHFNLDLFIVRADTWGIQYTLRTGPSDFSHKCVTPRKFGGYLPPDCEYIEGATRIERAGETVPLPEEIDFLNLLELGWIEPGKRGTF